MDKKIINKNFKACSLKKQPNKLTLNKTQKKQKHIHPKTYTTNTYNKKLIFKQF